MICTSPKVVWDSKASGTCKNGTFKKLLLPIGDLCTMNKHIKIHTYSSLSKKHNTAHSKKSPIYIDSYVF